MRCLATEVAHVPRQQVSKIEGDGRCSPSSGKRRRTGAGATTVVTGDGDDAVFVEEEEGSASGSLGSAGHLAE